MESIFIGVIITMILITTVVLLSAMILITTVVLLSAVIVGARSDNRR